MKLKPKTYILLHISSISFTRKRKTEGEKRKHHKTDPLASSYIKLKTRLMLISYNWGDADFYLASTFIFIFYMGLSRKLCSIKLHNLSM